MRINKIECRSEDWDGEPVAGRFFLIEVHNQSSGARWYSLEMQPGRTNMSHEVQLDGWLGTTNNIDRTACGAVEVYRDARGRLACRKISAEKLLDAVSPNVDLDL